MDLAIYISELLGQRGELQISGVGYFAQTRVNGYYNDREQTFYPPAHKVDFNADVTGHDDALAEYIAGKKNISLLSAKYFVDKYLSNLKQEVLTKQVELADLGYLVSENSRIFFKASRSLNETDPEFYGFKPVKVQKQNSGYVAANLPVIENVPEITVPEESIYIPRIVTEEVLTDEPLSKPQVYSPHDHEQELLEIEEQIRQPNMPVIVIFIITIVALILFGIYLYNPALFGSEQDTTAIIKPVDSPKANPAKTSAAKDSAVKNAATSPVIIPATIATPQDTLNKRHYELLGGAFKTKAQIDVAIKNYQSLGLKPRILQHATGKLYKITLGTYFSFDEASRAQDSIVKVIKINKTSTSIQPINPRK